MEILFLGTGTSQGVPMIACDCAVCRSDNPRNRRTRTSVHVVMDGVNVQVDAAPEFREQCIRLGVKAVDLFILTHGHADHVMGMDDLRRFCDRPDSSGLPVYSSEEGLQKIRQVYPYAVSERPVFLGYPAFSLGLLPPVLELECGSITSTLLPHGPVQVLGLVFKERGSDDGADGRGGMPDRALHTAGAGAVQDALYASPGLHAFLSAQCGHPIVPSGNRGSYSYYVEPGDHLGLHLDVDSCDVTLITVLHADTAPADPGGGLAVYPSRLGAPLRDVRDAPEAGMGLIKADPGQSIVILGGLVPHRVLPLGASGQRIISALCFTAAG
jgi:hypothetical protein